MMEGIEVLAIGSIGTVLTINWPLAIGAGLVLGIGFGLWCGSDTGNVHAGILTGVLIGFVFFLFVAGISSEYIETIPTYKVIIEDTVSMNDFMEKYEIIEQEGKIYTIKERTNANSNNYAAP